MNGDRPRRGYAGTTSGEGGFELTSLTRPGSPDINYFPGDFDDYDEVDSGDLACGKARRKDWVLIRRGRAFTVGLGDPLGATDSPSTSPVAVRSNFGVETLQKTASLYLSTTPRANKIRPKSDNFLRHQP
jgi:hypothetical protein